jgi:YbgC/YbaW family acyl-CoA thioester hydrolase
MAAAMYWKEVTVHWGESDPFGLVYYPRIVAWFNETEHEFFRTIGFPVEQMIRDDRTTFVMGEIHFRFIGPAAYGDRLATTITLTKIGERTLHWACKARNAVTGAPVTEGKATRVYARINEDGTLSSAVIPARMRKALLQSGQLSHLRQDIEKEPEYRHLPSAAKGQRKAKKPKAP